MKTQKWMKVLWTLLMVAFIATGCTKYDDDIDNLNKRVDSLEESVKALNSSLDELKTIVSAVESGDYVTNVEELADGSGYVVTFAKAGAVTIKNGSNGVAGTDAPVVGVKEEDGVYYWTLTIDGNTDFIYQEDGVTKLPVSGTDGKTPQMGIDSEGYWTVNGEQVKDDAGQPVKAQGEPGANGDSFFTEVNNEDENFLVLTLKDGSQVSVPKQIAVFCFKNPNQAVQVKYGSSSELELTIKDISYAEMLSCPEGWTATLDLQQKKVEITAPVSGADNVEGLISFIGIDAKGNTLIASQKVETVTKFIHTITFEDKYWNEFLASNKPWNTTYTSTIKSADYNWQDPTTSLVTPFIPTAFGMIGRWVVSSWNSSDIVSRGDYLNDLYVYNKQAGSDNVQKGGGNNGSDRFLIGYGYFDESGFTSEEWAPVLKFADETPRVIKSCYVNSNCYFLNVTANGNDLSPALGEGEDVTIHAIGYNADGQKTKEVTMLFADKSKVTDEWTKWDLSSLGEVVSVRFNMTGGTNNGYGFSLPAYYAVDDITVEW